MKTTTKFVVLCTGIFAVVPVATDAAWHFTQSVHDTTAVATSLIVIGIGSLIAGVDASL